MMDFQFRKILLSDYNIALRNPVNIDSEKEIQNIPGISYVEEKFEVACHFINRNYRKKGKITGLIKNAELTKPCLINGKNVKVPESGLLMTSRLAEQLHLKPGDTVKIIPVKGRRKAKHVKVMRLIDSTFGLPVYANYQWLNLLVGEEAAVTGLQMKGRMNRKELNNMFRELKKFPQLASFDIISRQKTQMKHEFIDKLQTMTYTMIIFAGVIFFASILNASLIELSDRKREIATFRVLGYTGREIGDIFLRKALLINITGAFLGLPLGYFMLYAMTLQFKNDMYSTPCIVKIDSWVLTIILSFVFVIGAFSVIQKVINKMEWSEALKMKE
jgi:putative ABC transport system permease protein